MQSANIARNVSLLCQRFLHDTVARKQETLAQSTLAFSCEDVHKNCENESIIVKVAAKKSVKVKYLGCNYRRKVTVYSS